LIRKDFVFHWVGTGELLNAVKEKSNQCGVSDYIQFLGVRDDIPDILAACDIFLLPSFFEGLPLVLIEAQASGLTAFASNTVPNQVDAGGCRFLSIETGAETWAKEINSFIESGLIQVADIEKLKQFDIRNYVNKLENIYESAYLSSL
jgi:glycosyltransferase involved in cell wall biosynthesis